MMPAQGNAEDKRRRTKKKKQLLLDAEEQTKKIVATLYPNMIVCLANIVSGCKKSGAKN